MHQGHRTTRETIPLSRNPADKHPAWVHAQCQTMGEANLQRLLDQLARQWDESQTPAA